MTQNNMMLVYELSKAKSKIQNPTKNAEADHGRYKTKYATLEQVMTAVTDTLLEHGIVWQQIANDCEAGAKVETVLMGHGSEIHCGPVFVPAERVTPHAFGSAMTYARRYSLALACGVGSDEDNDALIVQEEYTSKPEPKDMSKQYSLVIDDDSKRLVIGTKEYLEALRGHLKNKKDDEVKVICKANKSDIIVAKLDTESDKTISDTIRQNRLKFLNTWVDYANAS